jgi:hypothetical protein
MRNEEMEGYGRKDVDQKGFCLETLLAKRKRKILSMKKASVSRSLLWFGGGEIHSELSIPARY